MLRAGLLERADRLSHGEAVVPLSESSDRLDNGLPAPDVFDLMPALAYRLDREIRRFRPGASLDQVFAAVCRMPREPFDVLSTIQRVTGYDPGPLFKRYFYSAVRKPDELLVRFRGFIDRRSSNP
jgi:hypothetical protein